MTELLKTSVSIFPILIFLFGLVLLDSFKLIRFGSLIVAIIIGGFLAFLCFYINHWLLELSGLSTSDYSRYLAVVVEELVKATYLVYLLWSRRVGFLVDAAIYGFAIGAGFALVENIYFLLTLESSNMFVWVVRGIGTAAMHGGTTAILAILTKAGLDRTDTWRVKTILPGLLVAMFVHSLYNHFVLSPLLLTIAVLVILSLLLLFVFEISERITRVWLDLGLDLEVELLEVINKGKLSQTNIGKFLSGLRSSLPGEVVGDILCYLRLYLELVIRAKGILLMRQSGVITPFDPEIKEKLTELKYLERSIGKIGKLAIRPLLRMSNRDLWQLYILRR